MRRGPFPEPTRRYRDPARRERPACRPAGGCEDAQWGDPKALSPASPRPGTMYPLSSSPWSMAQV